MERRGLKRTGAGLLLGLCLAAAAAAQDTVDGLVAEARELERSGRHAEAESLYRRALKIQQAEEKLPPELARTLAELGRLSELQGRPADAERFYRRAIAVGDARGLDEAEIADVAASLGALCVRQSRDAEAEPLYRRVVGIRESLLGPDHPDLAGPREELARLEARRRPAAAEAPAPAPEVPPVAPPSAGDPPRARPGASRVHRAQVAARRDAQAAEETLRALRSSHPDLLGDLPARVVRVDLGERGVWHRVQIGEFPDAAAANALCAALRRRGHEGCWVIATESG